MQALGRLTDAEAALGQGHQGAELTQVHIMYRDNEKQKIISRY
jgi:hypothetical protein